MRKIQRSYPNTRLKHTGIFLHRATSVLLLILIIQIAGCTSPVVKEFTVSVNDKTYKESPVISDLNREEENFIKIALQGYIPYSTKAEFKERQWRFANLKFGKQILLALDINTGYLYKLLPEHMHDLLKKENTTPIIEQNKFYFITVQAPDDTTWWRNIIRLKPIPAT